MPNNSKALYNPLLMATPTGGPSFPDPFGFHDIDILCEIADLGDVNPEILIQLTCEIGGGNLTFLHDIDLDPTFSTIGDVNPTIGMNFVFVVVQVITP